jgi:hypothetical protein
MITIIIHNDSRNAVVKDDETEVNITLPFHERKAILQILHDCAYNKRDDIFYLPSEVIDQGQKVGVK